jgi:hypothetical protein
MAEEQSTSLKELFQGMIPTDVELMQGTVISVSPLKIQMVNDEKLIINERITVVPRHLSDYTTEATFSVGKGTLTSVTTASGSHEHSGGTHSGHTGGNGSHEHSGGTHSHPLSTYALDHGTLTVWNALKVGEVVYVLSLNNGKLYYVLDRVVE